MQRQQTPNKHGIADAVIDNPDYLYSYYNSLNDNMMRLLIDSFLSLFRLIFITAMHMVKKQ